MAKRKALKKKPVPARVKKAKGKPAKKKPAKKAPVKAKPKKASPAKAKTKKASARQKPAPRTPAVAGGDYLEAILRQLADRAAQSDLELCVSLTSKQDPNQWAQLKWDMVNLSYPSSEEPEALLSAHGIPLIEFAGIHEWSANQFLTIEHGTEPVEPIAQFVKAYFERILKVSWREEDVTRQEEIL